MRPRDSLTLLFIHISHLLSRPKERTTAPPASYIGCHATRLSFHFPRNTKIVAHAVRIGAQRKEKQRRLPPYLLPEREIRISPNVHAMVRNGPVSASRSSLISKSFSDKHATNLSPLSYHEKRATTTMLGHHTHA